MLNIIPASQAVVVTQLIVCLYAPPGVGKTTLGFTASKPLLLDFDRGAYRAKNRKDHVPVSDWRDVAAITRDDVAEFNTIVIDTAGRAADALAVDIIRRNGKMGSAGQLNLKGFGQLKSEFRAFLNLMTSFGKDVVLIAHVDEQRSGDEIVERLDVQGSSKGEIYKSADAMGRIRIIDRNRVLTFSPTDTAFGKNPGELAELTVPAPGQAGYETFLADVIAKVKASINTLTEEQTKAMAEQAAWRDRLDAVEEGDPAAAEAAYNKLLAEAHDAPKVLKAMLHHSATAAGMTFKNGAYAAPVAAPAAAAPPAPAAGKPGKAS